jgi:hypothetical protein
MRPLDDRFARWWASTGTGLARPRRLGRCWRASRVWGRDAAARQSILLPCTAALADNVSAAAPRPNLYMTSRASHSSTHTAIIRASPGAVCTYRASSGVRAAGVH